MTDHLGYEQHSSQGWGSGNSRNGSYPKTVATDVGDVRLDIPRDRNGSFEPQTVPVGSRRLSGIDEQIISLYAEGLTTGDIAAHLFDVYDKNIDKATISRVTDGIVDDMLDWQSRPLGWQHLSQSWPVGGAEDCRRSDPFIYRVINRRFSSISSHRFRAMIATIAVAMPATSRPLTCSPQASLPIKAISTRLDAEKSVNARADRPSKPPASARSRK